MTLVDLGRPRAGLPVDIGRGASLGVGRKPSANAWERSWRPATRPSRQGAVYRAGMRDEEPEPSRCLRRVAAIESHLLRGRNGLRPMDRLIQAVAEMAPAEGAPAGKRSRWGAKAAATSAGELVCQGFRRRLRTRLRHL